MTDTPDPADEAAIHRIEDEEWAQHHPETPEQPREAEPSGDDDRSEAVHPAGDGAHPEEFGR